MPDLPDDLTKYMGSIGMKPGAAPEESEGGSWNPFSTKEATTDYGAVGKGIIQGGLGYIEAPAQLAEWGLRKVTGNENLKLPGHDWASAYKRGVESSTEGNIGEAIGSAIPMFTPLGWLGAAGRGASLAARGLRGAEELPSFLGAAGKGAETVSSRLPQGLARELGQGAAGAALSQPVSGDNFVQDKLQQMLAGAVLGRVAGQVGRGMRYSNAEELAAKEAGFTSRGAQRASQKQSQEEFRKAMDEGSMFAHMGKNQPKWAKERAKAAKAKDESIGGQLKGIAAHLAPHILMHHIPGLSMFGRWQAARALGKLAEQARMPNASPELRAAADRIFRRIPYNPGAIPFTVGAQADRYYPQEFYNEEAQ